MQRSNSSPVGGRASWRRRSDALVAPQPYRPVFEDYDPLRRKSDTLELPPTITEELGGSRRSSVSSYGSHGSGDTLILPAITMPGPPTGSKSFERGAKPRTISLPAVTVTADPESAEKNQTSFFVPASKVKYALMVRGRRSSSTCVASSVFEHPLVSFQGNGNCQKLLPLCHLKVRQRVHSICRLHLLSMKPISPVHLCSVSWFFHSFPCWKVLFGSTFAPVLTEKS